ncbi:MAG: shikimate kinase [Caulobacteraceae bacterium]|nr:shikimate kinase [Caulobacteraceae bacterium]
MSKDPLRSRTIALVGLMGAGKTSVGRRLASALNLPFRDADEEIEKAAGRSITDIFAEYGEAHFRDGERRVIARLLDEPPHVLATGGGAFMNAETRALIKAKATSVWLKADLDTLARRVGRKDTRPLLKGRDAREALNELAGVRYPVYAEADVTIESGDTPHHATVDAIIKTLKARLEPAPSTTACGGEGGEA